MSVATAIYIHIYCRYLSPGECVVHDRGLEFCNEVSRLLHSVFGVPIRVISAGRPRGNGLAENRVKTLKEKMRALMSEDSENLPTNWDATLLHKALSILRSDPSCATGFAPGQLLLGRPLVYPFEIEKSDVDFSGTELTRSVVNGLNNAHDKIFGKAGERILAYQKEYKDRYDRKMNVNGIQVQVGSRVQLRKRPKRKMNLEWTPRFGYLEVTELNESNMTVKLRNPVTKYIFKKSKPISKLRLYRK